MKKKYIFLNPDGSSELGLCLVVEEKTGIEYSTQCAGLATEERTIEGFLIPLGFKDIEDKIYDFFWKEFKGSCYEPYNKWSPDRISMLKELIGSIPCWLTRKDNEDERLFLKLDEERLKECVEAWIPVISPYGKGILMLKNSD